jgi:hypothetical protein
MAIITINCKPLRDYFDLAQLLPPGAEFTWSDGANRMAEQNIGATFAEIGTTPGDFISRFGQDSYLQVMSGAHDQLILSTFP